MVGEDPMRGMVLRTIFAFPILLTGVIIFKGFNHLKLYFSHDLFPYVILTALLIVIGDGAFLFSLKTYDVSQILPIASVYPLFTTLILVSTGTEPVSTQIYFGTAVIIVGVAIVTGSKGKSRFSPKTVIYGIFIGLCWGSSIFFVRKILADPRTNPFALTGIRTLFMGIFGLLIYLVKSNQVKKVKRDKGEIQNSIKFLALSGITGWVLGASLFFVAVQRIGAAIPTPITSTNPVFAGIVGTYLHLEQVNWVQFVGIICTVIGTIIIVM